MFGNPSSPTTSLRRPTKPLRPSTHQHNCIDICMHPLARSRSLIQKFLPFWSRAGRFLFQVAWTSIQGGPSSQTERTFATVEVGYLTWQHDPTAFFSMSKIYCFKIEHTSSSISIQRSDCPRLQEDIPRGAPARQFQKGRFLLPRRRVIQTERHPLVWNGFQSPHGPWKTWISPIPMIQNTTYRKKNSIDWSDGRCWYPPRHSRTRKIMRMAKQQLPTTFRTWCTWFSKWLTLILN